MNQRYKPIALLIVTVVSSTWAETPSPEDRLVGPLPTPVRPPAYRCDLAADGGFTVTVEGKTFRVESSYSYPHGGDNRLSTQPIPDTTGESEWEVSTEKVDEETYRVKAAGKFYTIDRWIRLTPTRIEVEDTVRNRTDEVVGIILSNHLNTQDHPGLRAVAYENPTVFVADGNVGIGLIALDDLYYVHLSNVFSNNLAAIRDEHFGLDKGASYTLRWAVYPIATGDYYDFINAIRKDEGLNGYVEGGFSFTRGPKPPSTTETVPLWDILSREEATLKGLEYYSGTSLTRLTENPTLSLEGWEFVEYPDIRRRLKDWMGDSKQENPGVKVGFHVAHSLYATNRPQELFPDSQAVDADGNMDHYGPDTMEYYGKYFSKELVEDNWRWWLYYPTMENSFGKTMLDAADVMIEDLGATLIWADGYISGYIGGGIGGGFTYDRWDRHSVTIDPTSKLVERQKAHVTFLALPVLKAVAQKFIDADCAFLTNGRPGPISFVKMPVLSSNETSSGNENTIPRLHLGSTVTPLGNPGAVKNAEDLYADILSKLDWGALYFWHGERQYLTEPTIVSNMYPITFQSIHAGTVRGRERIVTKNSGIYGWHGDRSLHMVYSYNKRGRLQLNEHLTSVVSGEVRTELTLRENESAVIAKLSIEIEANDPINLIVRRYSSEEVELSLHGKGNTRLIIKDGEFPVTLENRYKIHVGEKEMVVVPRDGILTVDLALDGPVPVVVRAIRRGS